MASQAKQQVVQDLKSLFKQYPIVAAVNMANLPTKQLQNMRAQLRQTVVLRCAKRRLIQIAIKEVQSEVPGVENLLPHVKGIPALLFTKDNPFALYKKIQKNKSTAPAKAGQIATRDIVVPAGPTNFAPGPVIGELGSIGAKAGIENGKVVIKQDSVVVKEGQEISAKAAGILTRLGIEPMEIGLNVTAVLEKGAVFESKILAVDEQQYISNISQASRWALNLAVEAAYFTNATNELLVQKAFREAKAVALETGVLADGVVPDVLAKAERTASGLKQEFNL